MNGIIAINKEKDMTSRDVVNQIGKIFNTKKVGHTGTLDPMATGVLIVCIGSYAKLVEIITCSEKTYQAEVTLGIKTDTGDITGNILKEENAKYSFDDIKNACKEMTKTYEQTVPIYSAVKINGKKLYEYARKEEEIELPKREVSIYELNCTEPVYQNGKTTFTITTTVSKGTYIRSLIEDIASTLGTVGTMSKLTRIKQGKFSLEESYSIKDIEQGNFECIKIENILDKYPKVVVDSYIEEKIKNGSLLENRYKEDKVLFVSENGNLLAIYQIYEKDSSKVKPWKMLYSL